MTEIRKMPCDSFARRASSYIVSQAIIYQDRNNFMIGVKEVWRAIEGNWPDHRLPQFTERIAEKICKEIMENFPVAAADFYQYEGEQPVFDIVMYTEYTAGATCGGEDY